MISIITVCLNSSDTIRECLESVIKQDYDLIEYIVIDGGSTDGTCEIISEYIDSIDIFISESDNGLYDAINKGILKSSGDVIALMHSDDCYSNTTVVSEMARFLDKTNSDCISANLEVVSRNDPNCIYRKYVVDAYTFKQLSIGIIPAHPTFFIKRNLFELYGLYNTNYKIASDVDLIIRVLTKKGVVYNHYDKFIIKMKDGGISSSNFIKKHFEVLGILNSNGFEISAIKLCIKYLYRLREVSKSYFKRGV